MVAHTVCDTAAAFVQSQVLAAVFASLFVLYIGLALVVSYLSMQSASNSKQKN